MVGTPGPAGPGALSRKPGACGRAPTRPRGAATCKAFAVRFAADRPLRLAPATAVDYRELARRRIPRQIFDYVDGGAYDEATMRANVADLARVLLRQVVMRDVSMRDASVEVLGQRLALPVILAPVGLAGMLAPRAEVQ